MELIWRYATEAQKQQWINALLVEKIRSVFAMNEADVASSEARKWLHLQKFQRLTSLHKCFRKGCGYGHQIHGGTGPF